MSTREPATRTSEARPPAGGGATRPPFRVLFVIGQLGLGGAEKNLVELIQGMDRTAIEPMVLVFNPGGEWEVELRRLGVPVHAIARKYGRFGDRLLAIGRLCRAHRPDVLHAFDMVTSPYCAMARLFVRVPSVYSCFLATYMVTQLRYAQILLGPLIDRTVCNSERGRRYLIERCHTAPERLMVIANGLDFRRMEQGRAGAVSLRRELGIGADQPLIGMVGKLNADKNPMVFARAALSVQKQFPAATFCIIGAGPHRDMVQRFVEQEGLRERFFLVPQRPDAAWLAREFDVAVLSSSTEGLPTAVTEYMYWEKPVVVTDVGECSRVVLDGETGRVVPPDDPEAFAAAILDVLRDPIRAREMGRAGRRRLEKYYTVERYVADYVRLYVGPGPAQHLAAAAGHL
jgi:glycosyltransferase involved in cell wall biosynthesis